MITQEVIKEIYKNYNKPCKNADELNLPYFADLLKEHHHLTVTDDEVVVDTLEEFSPFRRFLIRGLYAVLEFDYNVAFVFESHIIFFNKNDDRVSVDFKPVPKRSFLDRLFGRDDDEDDI